MSIIKIFIFLTPFVSIMPATETKDEWRAKLRNFCGSCFPCCCTDDIANEEFSQQSATNQEQQAYLEQAESETDDIAPEKNHCPFSVPPEKKDPAAQPASRKVLIIEDSDIPAKILKNKLTALGFRNIHLAKDGGEGITKFQALKPDLIFMDKNMPTGQCKIFGNDEKIENGIVATQKIRILQKAIGVTPIIICFSDDDTPETIADFERSGVNGFFHKHSNKKPLKEVLGSLGYLFDDPHEASVEASH